MLHAGLGIARQIVDHVIEAGRPYRQHADVELLGLAACLGCHFAERLKGLREFGRRLADRYPSVAVACGSLQRAPGHSAYEDRRPRLLDRLRNRLDVTEAEMPALVTGDIFSPQRL